LWPGLSEDVVRYRLEGRMWLSGVSPYAHSPGEFIAAHPDRVDAIDRAVTYPDMQTIYPPAAQGLFVLGRWLEGIVPAPAVEPAGGPVEPQRWRDLLESLPWWRQAAVFRLLMGLMAVAG